MPSGETVPKTSGYYKASITVGGKTVSVKYQIKDPTSGITLDAAAAAGQQFTAIGNSASVSIPKDGSFTAQFIVVNLTTAVYNMQPSLSFGSALPSGTTIIMQTADSYYYQKLTTDTTELALNTFTKMGGTEKFTYTAVQNQTYRFIVDFSQATGSTAGSYTVTLTYKPTGSSAELKASVTVACTDPNAFGLTNDNGTFTVSAPSNPNGSRWNGKQLILMLTETDKTNSIPADAKLTVTVEGTSTTYSLNAQKQFVVPLTWRTSQIVQTELNSKSSQQAGKSFELKAELFVGTKAMETTAQATVSNVSLTIPAENRPSVKLTGKQRLFTNENTLPLTVETNNTNGCTVNATIQSQDGTGNFLSSTPVTTGDNTFSLSGITQSGSYKLVVTVSKNGTTILEVPYYFIVQKN